VLHNYRWRLGLTEGQKQHDDIEKKLAASPSISVPTITLKGGRIGYNLPQEASDAFADTVASVASA
jgi:hypothetical protein